VALDDLNIAYDVWQVGVDGSEPGIDTLLLYDAVIWFSGDTPAGPSPDGEAALSSYLDSTGCMLISSQGYHKTWGLTSFISEYLGVAAVTDDVDYASVSGTGSVFGNVGTLALNDNSIWNAPAAINPTGQAEAAFTYANGNAGITRDSGVFKTVYLGFGLEDLALSSRVTIIGNFLNWCDGAIIPPTSTRFIYLPTILNP
jgi:hypothetical protein